jgi:predicted alpha/beta-hydrolase family hydrolase
MTTVRSVATPHGEARLHTDRARSPVATLLLGHGAGGGPDAADLVALADQLPRAGVTVVRLEQPWRVAGRRVAAAPPVLDKCLVAACSWLRLRTPLVLGGRSAGARSAARTSDTLGARGVLALSFPLHPPGRPEASRLPELESVTVPTLVVQGERDPFGTPAEFPRGQRLVVVPAADHSLRVPRRTSPGGLTQEQALTLVVESTRDFVLDVTGADRSGNRSRHRRVVT